jgi:hypothetical protein
MELAKDDLPELMDQIARHTDDYSIKALEVISLAVQDNEPFLIQRRSRRKSNSR